MKRINFSTVDWLLALSTLVVAVIFSYFVVVNHWGLKTQLDDLGNIAQPLWNSTQGRFMEYSNTHDSPQKVASRFAGHANFIYILLIPFYKLWSSPQFLLIVQAISVTSAAIPVYLLSKKVFTKYPYYSLIPPVIYWLNPSLHDALLYDIHAIVLGLPLITFSLYFMFVNKYRLFWLAALGLCLVKEDMPLLVTMMGFYQVIWQKKYKQGVIVILLSLSYFGIVNSVIMPTFRPESTPHLLVERRYGDLGDSPYQIIVYGITHPFEIVSLVISRNIVWYLFILAIGFGGVVMGEPLSMVMLPSLAVNFLSNNWIMHQPFGYYYTAPLIGVGAIAYVSFLIRWSYKKPKYVSIRQFVVVTLFISIIYSWFYSPLPYSRVSSWREFQADSRLAEIKSITALIDTNSLVSVQNNLGPHLINRQNIVKFPYRIEETRYVLIDMTDPYTVVRDKPRQRNFVHITQLFPQEYLEVVMKLFDGDDFGVIYFNNGLYLFERNASRSRNLEAKDSFIERAKDEFAPYEAYTQIQYPEI